MNPFVIGTVVLIPDGESSGITITYCEEDYVEFNKIRSFDLKQRGFIALPLTTWAMLGLGMIVLGLGMAVKVQTARLDAAKAEHAAFVAQVKQNGEIAAKAAKLKEAQDAKQISDAITARNAALKRLRDDNSASRRVPIVPAAAAGSETICFQQSALSAAVERYRAGVRGLVAEGDAAQIDAIALIQAWPLKMAREIR